uniref:Uncharacterized protein n=1 Tax=Rhizophora mucronata TaxID=61149 RepID=A0A2P2NTT9_RHIMU
MFCHFMCNVIWLLQRHEFLSLIVTVFVVILVLFLHTIQTEKSFDLTSFCYSVLQLI